MYVENVTQVRLTTHEPDDGKIKGTKWKKLGEEQHELEKRFGRSL